MWHVYISRYLHNYYWYEPTTVLIIVDPRRPSSMFRVILSVIIFRLLIPRSEWPSSSAHRGSLIRHPRWWMRHQTGCTTVASLATTNQAHHRRTTLGWPCRFQQRHRQVLLEQCWRASSGRSRSTSHHGSRPPDISCRGSTRQQLHQHPIGPAKSLP